MYDRVAVQQTRGDDGADHKNGRKQGQQQQWEQQFAHAGLRGDGRDRSAGNGDAKAANKENKDENGKIRENRNVVKNGEDREA